MGYVGNITESVGETGSLVTDYAYEQNIYSDNQFLKDHLEAQTVYEEPAVLVADGAYNGERNVSKAKEHNIRLVTTNFTGYKPSDVFAGFIFDEPGQTLLECANHKKPIRTYYDEHNDRCKQFRETCAKNKSGIKVKQESLSMQPYISVSDLKKVKSCKIFKVQIKIKLILMDLLTP